jgi:hypothetical protein
LHPESQPFRRCWQFCSSLPHFFFPQTSNNHRDLNICSHEFLSNVMFPCAYY